MLQPELPVQNDNFLENEVAKLHHQINLLNEQNKILRDQNSQLQEMLLELKRHRFGKKSERWQGEEQLLFNEVEVESRKPDIDTQDTGDKDEIKVKSYTKKRGKRKPLPENLPREIVKIELPPEERFAEDGTPLKIIGYEISEKLDYEPAKTKVLQYHRAKYGIDNGDYIKTAPPEPSIIPKGMAAPGLLAAIAVSKFADGLPLYRQEEIFSRQDIELSRTTMARWMIKVAEALRPIWNVLSDRLIENFYVSCDETRTQVLKEKGRRAESKSWMWVRSTPYGKHKIVLFDYNPSRSGDVAFELLEDFEGYLQVDGYGGYNKLSSQEGVTRIGCNMHGRRYFEKAFTTGAKSGKTLAEVALGFYKKLYELEDEFKEKPPDDRHRLREEKAKPIWDEFKAWADENQAKVPPTGKIGKAFTYFMSEYEHLTGYLQDGRLEADSGFVEWCIRKFAIGRNNWMFSDTEEGAEASALLYSLVITAKVNGVNPYRALKHIIEEIPKTHSLEEIERLADIIVAAQPIS